MGSTSATTRQNASALSIRNIFHSYSQRSALSVSKTKRTDVLKGISLEIPEGQTLGLVGESGCGKTTLVKAILRLIEPTAGQILLTTDSGQKDLLQLSKAELKRVRRSLQVVFQDPFASLSPRMTVGQIVGEGLALHRGDLSAAERDKMVLQMLDEVGLSERSGVANVLQRYPHEFSGGQRQRISIARAVVLRPEVLVLDEPTSALDVSVQQQVLTLLAELQQRYAMSYIFVSHDLALIRAMAHRVLVMKDGAVIEEGEATTLFDAPREPYTQTLLAAAHLA